MMRPSASTRAVFALLLASILLGGARLAAQVSEEVPEVELTSPVRRHLLQIQEEWVHWDGAFFQGDREEAEQAESSLRAIARQLGMTRLPDLCLGGLARGLQASRDGDFERAHWALAAAERLDPGRPETAFAEAAVARAEGHLLDALRFAGRGSWRLLELPRSRALWLADAALWAFYSLLAAGALLVAVEMGVKGSALGRDMMRLLEGKLPPGVAHGVIVVLLVWPLVLPSPLLALLVYWSVLLWGYGSWTERGLFIGLWLLLGVLPLAVGRQEVAMAVALSPEERVVSQLPRGSLYGELFNDAGALLEEFPEEPAVEHFLADLHGTLGQWELARIYYDKVLVDEPQNSWALLNLGVYSYEKEDFGQAVDRFREAASMDPDNVAAFYNLSQAYGAMYLFDDSRAALAQAQKIDNFTVSRHLSEKGEEELITVPAGLARGAEIERLIAAQQMGQQGSGAGRLAEQGRTLLLGLGLIVGAVVLHLVRRRHGYTESPLLLRLGARPGDRWRRIFLPGLGSAEVGEGGRAFLALLVPSSLLLLLRMGSLGLELPTLYAGSSVLTESAVTAGLVLFFSIRILIELREGA